MHKKSVYFHKMVAALQAVCALFVFGSHGVGGWKLGFDRLGHVCEQSVGVVTVWFIGERNPRADL